jgi:hypothetical protein
MLENRQTSRTSRTNQERDRSAKMKNYNADAHAREESDCAVVPMNRPNKGEESSAEAGEGPATSDSPSQPCRLTLGKIIKVQAQHPQARMWRQTLRMRDN